MIVEILVLAYLTQEHWSGHPYWLNYQRRLSEAYAIDVRWEKQIDRGAPESWRLSTLGKDRISLERMNSHRIVWNKNAGLHLDLAHKTYHKLIAKPEFNGAEFLELPNFQSVVEKKHPWPFRAMTQRTSNSSLLHGIEVKRNEVDYGVMYSYWFDSKSSLMASFEIREMMPLRRLTVYRIKTFDVTPLPDNAQFHLEPPTGFTEKKPS